VKSAQDPRHLKRIAVFKSLFAGSFTSQPEHPTRVDKIMANIEKINDIIQKCAPEWPISQINRVDLSVLQQAVYELLIKTETPTKVIIDEAVEIAKRYGGKTSSSFVNGALASAINFTGRSEKPDEKPAS
jgi:transcription antitermination protein NusB